MEPLATYGPIDGRNVLVGTHVSGAMNVTFNELRQSPLQHHETFSTVPFQPDHDFVERPDVAIWLREKCNQPGARAAFVGLGGIGKSQQVISYAHQVRKQSPDTYIFWVHASTRPRFEEAYRKIADRLQLPGRHDPKNDVLQLVYEWLFDEKNGKWLIIVDNADDINLFYPKSHEQGTNASSIQQPLASYLPQCIHGKIIITSRSNDVAERLTGGHWNVWLIMPMNEEQAKQLLRNKLQGQYDETVAADLVSALECIPLAITQAAAYILRRSPRMSPLAYLNEFHRSDKKKANLLYKNMGDLRRDIYAANSVVVTWQITFQQIQQERQSAADLLSFMSLFNPQGIPEWILRSYQRRKYVWEAWLYDSKGSEDDDDKLDDDLDTLRGYSLVTQTTQNDTCQMHALVQFCTQVWLSSVHKMEKWRDVFLRVMSVEYPSTQFTTQYENWTKCQQLEPHIARIMEMEPLDEEHGKIWTQILSNIGCYRYETGRYEVAKVTLKKAVGVSGKIFGTEHISTLLICSTLAVVLRYLGKYKKAEQMNRRVLDGFEKELGKDDPKTLTTVTNLALVLKDQSKYNEAEQMSRRALDGCEKLWGKGQLLTIASANNLALILQSQGKYKEAEPINRRALNSLEEKLGKDHPDTLTSVHNLALVLLNKGEYKEAEQLNRRVLNGYEKTLGKDHGKTLASVSNLSVILQYQGKYEEAEHLSRRALSGREQALGKNHPDTLTSISNLAFVLKYRGKHTEAERMHQRALDSREKVLGKDHVYKAWQSSWSDITLGALDGY